MRNTIKFLGIIALVAVIGFSMTACDELFGTEEEGDPPATPALVNATAISSSSITVTWTAVSGATGYNVYRSTSAGGTYTQVGTPTASPYMSTGLTADTTYYYKVSAKNANGESSQSTYASAKTYSSGGNPPAMAPTGVNATAASSTSINVSWATVTGATGYTVYRSTSTGGTYSPVGTPITNSYTDTGLTANTTYYYQVSAKNAYGESTRSTTASATTNSSGGGTELTGTVTIAGIARVNQVLTADISDLNGTGTVSYQWKYGTTATGPWTNYEINATASTYTLASSAVGRYIAVTVTRSGYTGSVTGTMTDAVAAFGSPVTIEVTIFNSDGATTPGTLRYALTNALSGDTIRFSGVTPGTSTIELTGSLPRITKNMTIEGNGITLTWGAGSWTELLSIGSYDDRGANVTISRVWFKDCGAGAISNYGNLTVESCIFSGNRKSSSGGAIYSIGGVKLTVKGCTFYGNSAESYGGAIYNNYASGTSDGVTLTGNLFYRNTAGTYGPVVLNTVASNGYNVVDVALGTSTLQAGWTAHATDKYVSNPTVLPANFKPLPQSAAADVITGSLPEEYPARDFYGTAISAPAAAGAVQEKLTGSGYALILSVNDSTRGSVNSTPAPNATNGLVSGTSVSITASPSSGCNLAYWLVNGERHGTTTSPLALTLTAHTAVHAVFARTFTVSVNTDVYGSADIPGTLRYAMTNAQNDDTISILSSVGTIALYRTLPTITKSFTIQGNGVTITTNADWTSASASTSSLIYLDSGSKPTIRGIHFKGGKTTGSGSAIYKPFNTTGLTLESCIFSGNNSTPIYNNGSLIIKGCTFYMNNTEDTGNGNSVYNYGGSLTLTGNIFYEDSNNAVVLDSYGGAVSTGYNVVNADFGPYGTGKCGWENTTDNDVYRTASPFSSTTTFAPASDLSTFVPSSFATNMPATDFNGTTRTWPGAPGAVK